MLDIFKKPIDVLFDTGVSLFKKFFIIICFIIGLFITNEIFQFSNHYVLSNKIELISNVEKIKTDTIQNYQMNPEILSKLNSIEISILDQGNKFTVIFLYLKKIQTGEISFNYKEFLSLQFFWILLGGAMIGQILKKGKDGVGEFIGFAILIVVMMYIWYILFGFISSIIGFKGIGYNLIINIIVIICLAWIGKKNK